jgi:hypothetical protein
MLKNYLKESWELKNYIISAIVVISVSYTVYLYCSDEMIIKLNNENQFFEIGTAVLFFVNALLFFISFKREKNIFLLMLSILMFIGAAEELSWGQALLNYKTPENIKSINVQGEFNLHNIEIFNTNNFNKTYKKGLSRLLEINFLFRIFIMTFGIILPLAANHISKVKKMVLRYKIPVVTLSIGIFFFISWIALEGLLYYLPKGKNVGYYSSSVEIFEFITSYIFLLSSIWFFKKNIIN